MKFIDEYRDSKSALFLSEKIKSIATKNWNIMEVCGGQTHTIMKYGIEELLPDNIKLIHGPGCPVCVTSPEIIDHAIHISSEDNVIFTSYGDMLRVPGTLQSLMDARADGADIRIIYSPLEAIKIAKENKDKIVVFFAIGFETTAPANGMAIQQAKNNGLSNLYVLSSQVLIPPAVELIMSMKNISINGLIAPGHVCAVTGFKEYKRISAQYKIPIAITGFEPLDLLQSIFLIVQQLETESHPVINQYSRVVKEEGNIEAQNIINDVFEICDYNWRGIGIIPQSGLKINPKYEDHDAERIFPYNSTKTNKNNECIAGDILCGIKIPTDCPCFGIKCTPANPLGAPMVSSEGACSAYYKYRSSN